MFHVSCKLEGEACEKKKKTHMDVNACKHMQMKGERDGDRRKRWRWREKEMGRERDEEGER